MTQGFKEGKQEASAHRDSTNSNSKSVHFDGRASMNSSAIVDDDPEHALGNRGRQRRRSSITARLGSIAHVGGVNSIENFAKSWTRAAGFHEATPRQPSLFLPHDEEHRRPDVVEYGRKDGNTMVGQRTSLLKAHFEAESPPDENPELGQGTVRQDFNPSNKSRNASMEPLLPSSMRRSSQAASRRESTVRHLATNDASVSERIRRGSTSLAPHAHVALPGSFGASYGTVHAPNDKASMADANEIWKGQKKTHDDEHEPLIVKEVEQDGHMILVVEGQSTLPQTIFNSTNCLIGVGILSLPLGIQYAGWLVGMGFFFVSALACGYAAKLLGKCMDVDPSLITFADLAFISFGNKARVITSILFSLELLAANVALVVLFADTLNLLIPTFSNLQYKVLSIFVLAPLNFAPLRVLSFTSVLGITCCMGIVAVILFDGIYKREAPGSLWQPRPIDILPSNPWALPLSFGLLMSPWGGASVFPNIYRDMRHPHKFGKSINITFTFTYILDAIVAVVGILMFGQEIRTEVTASILATEGYLGFTVILMSMFIAIIPLTKVPLNSRPIVSTLEVMCGIDPHTIALPEDGNGTPGAALWRNTLKFLIRIFVIIVFAVIAMVFPGFDSVVAFMGSGLCFAICVILPIMFYLKLFWNEISAKEKIMDYIIIGVSIVMAISGTIWAFLPKEMIGLAPE